MKMDPKIERLAVIPDYLASPEYAARLAGAALLALSEKVPPELRTGRFFDAADAGRRMALMLALPDVGRLEVFTPSFGYYRRLVELSDGCFFADVTLRALSAGADVLIETGLREGHLFPKAQEWIDELRRWGIRFAFRAEGPAEAEDRSLITAEDVLRCHKQGIRLLYADAKAIVTPYAWDEAKEHGITISRRV